METKENKLERIRQEVQETMAQSMEAFDFLRLIDETVNLTPKEKELAKRVLDWKVYIL